MILLRDSYIHGAAGIIRSVAGEHGFKNWHDLYLERLHKWLCRILTDGSLTGRFCVGEMLAGVRMNN